MQPGPWNQDPKFNGLGHLGSWSNNNKNSKRIKFDFFSALNIEHRRSHRNFFPGSSMFNVQSIEKIKICFCLLIFPSCLYIQRCWPDASYMSKCLPQYSDLSRNREKNSCHHHVDSHAGRRALRVQGCVTIYKWYPKLQLIKSKCPCTPNSILSLWWSCRRAPPW